MPTIEYDYFYSNVGAGGTIVGNGGNPPSEVYTFDYPDGVVPGQPVTVTDPQNNPIPFFYQGVTSAGDPVLSFSADGSGTLTLFSDQVIADGAQFPSWSATAFCFLSGTHIATPNGEVRVETLAIGDLVLTADGRTVPVKWLGRQTVFTRFGLATSRQPVRVAAGALGGGLPRRDLRLTADHALLLDGLLVQAGALVNGTTIRRMTSSELGQRFDVFHIETEAHDVILAEGVPAETFIDNVVRRGFDNYDEFETLYGIPAEPLRELPQPRIMSTRQLPATINMLIAEVAFTDLDATA